MSKVVGEITNFSGGIADSEKEGQKYSFSFGRAIDFRTDAKKLTLLPKAIKESGSYITALPKWAERIGTDTYIYDNDGNLYKRTSAEVYSHEHLASASHGNGLCYFGEDRYLYYTQDKTFGRWGPSDSSTANWYDDFLGSEGGVPTNTHSAVLELDSSQYFYRADTASLSITGDISLEAFRKCESLPATGEKMAFIAKWDEDAKRSYWFGINAISNFFGDGSDGDLIISEDTEDDPIDSVCSGTKGTNTLTATNASFVANQVIYIHQTRGTGAGTWQRTKIASYIAGTITTEDALNFSYATEGNNQAQVLVLKQYSSVTINADCTWFSKRWGPSRLVGTDSDGIGGILGFLCNGTFTNNGTISAARDDSYGLYEWLWGEAAGFARSSVSAANYPQSTGEGTGGAPTYSASANGNGGSSVSGAYGAPGGGNGIPGSLGPSNQGQGGNISGTADLTSVTFGGAGGHGGAYNSARYGSNGGDGGGILLLWAYTFINNGTITANGEKGDDVWNYPSELDGAGGGGAGGSIFIKANTATLGTLKITATGGVGGTGHDTQRTGGDGGNGRIHLDYYSSYTGTTNPTLNAIQDGTLGNSDGINLLFRISSTGENIESYTHEITDIIPLDTWIRWAVTWDASASTANFYKNGTLLATKTGALTSIHDNASQFFIGADKDSDGDAQNFFDGKCDDDRVWNDVRTATELVRYNDFILTGSEPNLIAYYKYDNDSTDSQAAGLNDLTGSGTPTYDATDPAFTGLTSRTDLDQSLDTSGNTYTLATAIDEGATHRQTFIPAKDPQKSIQVLIAAKGTGDWTLTVHDALNRTIASKTIANAEIVTAVDNEFVFSSVWRPVIGATYHFHLTSTVADGTVTTTDNADLETVDFHTYYQFLVEDTDFHPIAQMLNFLCIGNERYLSTYDGVTYTPHKLTLPSGYKIRCFGYWREYFAIGTWRGTSITDYDTGRIFFWDGYSDTYNFFIDVPEGGINALFGTKGLLYVWAGYLGDMLIYAGGDSAQKIKRIPKVEKDEYIEIFPGAVDMWRSMIHFGVAGNSDANYVEKGVYSYGSLNRNYAEALGYDFFISTGIKIDSSIKIGMIKSIGQSLLVGWQNNISYGIDKIDITSTSFSSGMYRTLLTDFSSIGKEKYPLTLKTTFEALASGDTIKTKYDSNRRNIWNSQTEDTVGATENRMTIHEQIKEIQIEVEIETTNTTSPVVTGIVLETEKGERERLA